jgi:hypothetical protein
MARNYEDLFQDKCEQACLKIRGFIDKTCFCDSEEALTKIAEILDSLAKYEAKIWKRYGKRSGRKSRR